MLLKIYEEGTGKVEDEFSMERLLKTTRDIKELLKSKEILSEEEEFELMF